MEKKRLPGKSTRADIDAFLGKVAAAPAVRTSGRKGRLIFAMDATASREPSWRQACEIQSEMFQQTDRLGGLEVQLCHYRGLSEFRASPWLSGSAELQARMSAVTCLGGHTQIRKVLRHTLAEHRSRRVNALVFVGDCMEESVDDLCQIAGQLGLHNVPVFLFHEGLDAGARRAFEQIARLTNGACCAFDAGSARQLGDLLAAVAVYAAGGRAALEQFSSSRGEAVKRLTSQLRKD